MPFAERRRPSAAVRAILAHRQDYKCNDCRAKLPIAWHVDHVRPLFDAHWQATFVSKAAATKAANSIDNLQALCANCHGAKSLLEMSEPDLLPPRKPRPATAPWQGERIRRRAVVDGIWAKASPRDPLQRLLLRPDILSALTEAQTDKDLRVVHKTVVRSGRPIDFSTFKRRVEHLLSS